ncbi:MAG: CoA transferase subunit A [Acidimicrobiia bacterium]|nr:CoA transferase subunit A [Acidimicrobiia bacterium]
MNTPERRSRLVDEVEAATWVESGMTIALGDPAPMAVVRQIVRRGVRDLRVVGSGLALDLLIGAGCVRETVAYYAGAQAPNFRRAVEAGTVHVWECEEGIVTTGLRAAAQGLPFLPWRGGLGTSLPDVNPDLKVFTDPIDGQTLLAVPAIHVDVAVLHAARADVYGNVVHVGGPGWLDLFLQRAADRVIVQVEAIVPNEEIRAAPWATTIADADAIVRCPWGAHPYYSRGYHVQDRDATRAYVDAASAGGPAFDAYLDRYVRGPATHAAYLETIGITRLLELYEY